MAKAKSAWLITWEFSADAAAVADEIAGVLPRQWSTRRVRGHVEWMYAFATSTVSELTRYAGRPSRNPYPAKDRGGLITCGHHPWLYGRIVSNLKVEVGADLFETVSWQEPDQWQLDESSGRVVRVAEGKTQTLTRRLRGSLSSDQIWDRSEGRFREGWGSGEMPPQPY